MFEQAVKDNEWFTEHIIVKDKTVTIFVDGKKTSEWTQPADWKGSKEFPERQLTSGTIALGVRTIPAAWSTTRTSGSSNSSKLRTALIIGGTRNLGPDIAAALIKAGFAVTVFHRGVTQSAALALLRGTAARRSA